MKILTTNFLAVLIIACFFSNFSQAFSANVNFTSDTVLNLSGLTTTLYAKSGSACDSLTTNGSILTASIPSGSAFTLGTGGTVLSLAPTTGNINLNFNTTYFSSGYLSQWSMNSASAPATVSISVGVPNPNTSYLIRVSDSDFGYFTSNSNGLLNFSYSGNFSDLTFSVIKGDAPGGGLPSVFYQPPAKPVSGFSVMINNGATITNSAIVQIKLNGGLDAKTMVVSEKSDFSDVAQEPYKELKTFSLSKENGNKTIYARFYTFSGQVSPTISTSIVLKENVTGELLKDKNTASIKAEIKRLQDLVDDLKGKLPLSSTSTPLFTKTLARGSYNKEVLQLQKKLKELGFFPKDHPATLFFGPITEKAVIEFQKANNLKPVGVIGPQTRGLLNGL